MRSGAGLKLERVAAATASLNFRRWLGQQLFKEINRHLQGQGLQVREGSIVDATMIAAAGNTNNREGQPVPKDAAGQARAGVALLDAAAPWGGCITGADPQPGDAGSQCDDNGQVITWGGQECGGRCWVSGPGQSGSTCNAGSELVDGDAARAASELAASKSAAPGGED